MKKILLIVIILGGAWWHYYGQNELSNESIDQFYAEQMRATLSRNPGALCEQLAEDYRGIGVTSTLAGRISEDADKEVSCTNMHQTYAEFEKIGKAMGGIAQIDYDHRIQSITIAPDKKTAKVETAFKMNIAGSIMQISGVSTDTLVKRKGKVKLQKSDFKMKIKTL